MKTLKIDHCIYIKNYDNDIRIVAVYVEDLIVATNNENKLVQFKEKLAETFELKSLDSTNHCIGIKSEQNKEGSILSMSHTHYVSNILKNFNMFGRKCVNIPANENEKFSKEMCGTEDKK